MPSQVRIGFAAVDVAADHSGAASRIMRVLGHRQDAHLRAVRIHAVREAVGALEELPAVVEAALAAGRLEVDLLPEVLADVADPEIAGLAVERELPWVADAERPDFRLGIRVISREVVLGQPEEIQDVIAGDERVVRGDRVALADRLPPGAARR